MLLKCRSRCESSGFNLTCLPQQRRRQKDPVESHLHGDAQRGIQRSSGLSFFFILGVIKKSYLTYHSQLIAQGTVERFKHQHTNFGWHTINAPDFHWLYCWKVKKRPLLASSLQQYYPGTPPSNTFRSCQFFFSWHVHSFILSREGLFWREPS